jgi:signal transduction histidine kinase
MYAKGHDLQAAIHSEAVHGPSRLLFTIIHSASSESLREPSAVERLSKQSSKNFNCGNFLIKVGGMVRAQQDHDALEHDLKNSINIILGFCAFLERSEPLTPNQARYLERIKRAAESMAQRLATASGVPNLARRSQAKGSGE